VFIFKVWVIGDCMAGTELHPSKQLHTASKHSMWGHCCRDKVRGPIAD